MLDKTTENFLKKHEFINIATCASDMQPNVCSKFLVGADSRHIWLADYCLERTYSNINSNPKVSLAVTDPETLIGYQLNGLVEVVEEEKDTRALLAQFSQKKTRFSTQRVIEGLHKEKLHRDFEVSFPDRVLLYKITIKEIIKINPAGTIEKTS